MADWHRRLRIGPRHVDHRRHALRHDSPADLSTSARLLRAAFVAVGITLKLPHQPLALIEQLLAIADRLADLSVGFAKVMCFFWRLASHGIPRKRRPPKSQEPPYSFEACRMRGMRTARCSNCPNMD